MGDAEIYKVDWGGCTVSSVEVLVGLEHPTVHKNNRQEGKPRNRTYVAWDFLLQEYVSAALKVPRNRIACQMKRTGGAFGGKVTKPALLGAVCAVAAHK